VIGQGGLKMEKNQRDKRSAPYVPAKALNAFFERIRYVSTPEKVDAGLLLDYGIPKGNVFALISALKFLGIIDEDNVPTQVFKALQVTGEEFVSNLQNVVRDSYADLFSKLDVGRDSREHIRNYFARNYSIAKASDATTLFIALCGQAGIPLSEELKLRRIEVRPRRIVPRRPRQDTTRVEKAGEKPQSKPQVIITDDDLRKMYLKTLIDQIAPPDTAGKDAEAIRAEAELRKTELDRIERLLKIIKPNERKE
jgi:hypothetical protein